MNSRVIKPMPSYENGRRPFSYILKSPEDYTEWSAFRADVEAVAAAGYQGVEIQMRSAQDFQEHDLHPLLDACGLRLAAIQTGTAYMRSGICLSTADAHVRTRAEDLLR